MTEPSDAAAQAVKQIIIDHLGDGMRLSEHALNSVCTNCAKAILDSYHAHLRSKGLKVTSFRMTQEMYNSAVARVRGGASYSDIWESMHEAAPEVMG